MRDHKYDLSGLRRFAAGDNMELAGLPFRVITGNKAPGDLRIDWYAPSGEWVPIPMSALFMLFDFFWENEHILYPPSRGYKGGEKLTQALRQAQKHGWRAATDELEAERRQAELRRQSTLFPEWEAS